MYALSVVGAKETAGYCVWTCIAACTSPRLAAFWEVPSPCSLLSYTSAFPDTYSNSFRLVGDRILAMLWLPTLAVIATLLGIAQAQDALAGRPSFDDPLSDLPPLPELPEPPPVNRPTFEYGHVFRPDPETCAHGARLNHPISQTLKVVDACEKNLAMLLPPANEAGFDATHVRNMANNVHWAWGVKDRHSDKGRATLELVAERISEPAKLLRWDGPNVLFPVACSGHVFVLTELVWRFDPRRPSVLTVGGLSSCSPRLMRHPGVFER